MNNAMMARLLMETADLMEIDGADSFRIRSYRNAADAVEQSTLDVSSIASDAARLQEISRIGKGMASRIQTIVETGSLPQRDDLVKKYGPGVLELRKLPGMGPKHIALFVTFKTLPRHRLPAARGEFCFNSKLAKCFLNPLVNALITLNRAEFIPAVRGWKCRAVGPIRVMRHQASAGGPAHQRTQ